MTTRVPIDHSYDKAFAVFNFTYCNQLQHAQAAQQDTDV